MPELIGSDRLLVGRSPDGAEARLYIQEGPLAGSEIRIRQRPGGLEATVLTDTASSRQTLVQAMAEVGRRMQARGRALSDGWGGATVTTPRARPAGKGRR